MQFKELKLIPPLVRAISQVGYSTATEIRFKVFPSKLKGNQQRFKNQLLLILNKISTESVRFILDYITLLFSIPSILQSIARKQSHHLIPDFSAAIGGIHTISKNSSKSFLYREIEIDKHLRKLAGFFNPLQKQFKDIQIEQRIVSKIMAQYLENIKNLIGFKMPIKHAHCAN